MRSRLPCMTRDVAMMEIVILYENGAQLLFRKLSLKIGVIRCQIFDSNMPQKAFKFTIRDTKLVTTNCTRLSILYES